MSLIGATKYMYTPVSDYIIYNGLVYCMHKQRGILNHKLYMLKYLTKSESIDSLVEDESYVLVY